MNIHPTAIIDPTAKLHPTVKVGPYSIIERNVTVDEHTEISSCVRIYANVKIGKSNKFYHNTVIGCDPQDLRFDQSTDTVLQIGDGNIFREGVHISRSTNPDIVMTIGNENFLMSNTHIGHDCSMGNGCIFASTASIGGHVKMGNKIFVSALTGVHQFCRIGDYAMAAGLGKITNDIPPYCTADGNPAVVIGLNVVGLRRAGFSSEVRRSIQNAYKIIYHSSFVTTKAIEELKKQGNRIPEVDNIIQFFENSKRGVTDHS